MQDQWNFPALEDATEGGREREHQQPHPSCSPALAGAAAALWRTAEPLCSASAGRILGREGNTETESVLLF